MADHLLVLNAGSSSLKFRVFGRPRKGALDLEARGQIEGIGTKPQLTVKDAQGKSLAGQELDASLQHGGPVLDAVATWLRSKFGGGNVLGVGHRVVHGGPTYTAPVKVDARCLSELKKLIPLAPLHVPYNLAAIEAVFEKLPEVPQVACFDTSFHRGRAAVTELVPLPKEFRDAGMQRYGFHGLSYEYIAAVLPEVAPEIAAERVVVAHLGSGASLCALKNGKSMDTTLGFTALDGLCMGTRPGSLDPGAVLYLVQGMGMSGKEIETLLYKKSGLLGISGISNDMRDLLGNDAPEARLAVDYFVSSAAQHVAAMAATLQGLDGLVFTAGIGENSAEIRRRILEACAWLGVEIDPVANQRGGPRISTAKSRVSAWVVPTNEELMIARHTAALLGL
ncbi:MAG TPA: acetate/propionate family kinase [Candidatus Polarisedimenticolia bacterium]|nr:acetate/propionate family kinase [Candidatus Polarisedimenticolia bacterium]